MFSGFPSHAQLNPATPFMNARESRNTYVVCVFVLWCSSGAQLDLRELGERRFDVVGTAMSMSLSNSLRKRECRSYSIPPGPTGYTESATSALNDATRIRMTEHAYTEMSLSMSNSLVRAVYEHN